MAEKATLKNKDSSKHGFFSVNAFKIIIVSFLFILYANSLGNGYNLDDELVTRNHRLTSKGISAIPEIFTSPYYQDNMGYSYEYRPMVLVSFAIENQFFGENPTISHFINILLYAIACVLLFRVLLLLFKNFSPVILLAIVLLFAAYPAHTEIVDSIKNRDDILGFIFSLLAMQSAIKLSNGAGRWRTILVTLYFLLALMSKLTILPFAIIIPLALLLFTEVIFVDVLIVTLALATPTFFMISFPSLMTKFGFIAGTFGIVSITYLILNSKKTLLWFKSLKYNNTASSETITPDFDALFTGNLNWKENLFPNAIEFKWYTILPTIILIAGFCVGLVWYNMWILLFCSILLIILQLVKLTPNSSIPTFGLYFCILITIYLLATLTPIASDNFTRNLCGILGFLLCMDIFLPKLKLIVPAFILFLCLWLIDFYLIKSPFPGVLALLPLFISIKFRYGKWPLLLFSSIYTIAFISSVIHYVASHDIYDINWIAGIGSLFTAFLFLRINQKFFTRPLIYILFFVVAIFYPGYSNTPSQSITDHVVSITGNPKTNLYNGKTDRPLSFVEESISYNDPLTVKLGTSLEIMWHYLYKTVLPYPMAFYYGYSFIKPMKLTDTIPIISLILHLLLAAMAILALIKKEKEICFGILIYFIAMGALCNFLQPVPGMFADRFLLFPSLGWCIVLVIGLSKIFKLDSKLQLSDWSSIKPAPKYILLGALAVYSTITFARNYNWKDDLTLFRHDVKYVDEAAQAHNLLALHIMAKTTNVQDLSQRLALQQEALQHFKNALNIYPRFFNVSYDIGRTYNEMSQTYQAMNNTPESYAMMDSAIGNFKYTITLNDTFSDLQATLSSLLLLRNREDEAIPYLQQLLVMTPHTYNPYDQLSLLYFKRHDIEKSVAINRLAIKNVPTIIDPYVNIARAYMGNNQMDSARYYLHIADEKMPNNDVIKQLLQQTGP